MSIDIGQFLEAPGTSVEEPADKVGEEQKPPELVYGSAEEFLHEQLLPTYVRDVDGRSATSYIKWYFYPEAVSRIEALWRAWKHLRPDGATGMSVWWRDHADHHMFRKCDMKSHRDQNSWTPNGPGKLVPERAAPASSCNGTGKTVNRNESFNWHKQCVVGGLHGP